MSEDMRRLHLVDSHSGEKNLPQADDAPARTTALDTQRSFLVEASAGSGKTELLIQRYLKLLAQVEDPKEILALTFTLKAAAEMRDRILQELREAEAGSSLEEASPNKRFTRSLALAALEAGRMRGWNLTRQPQRMNVRTIDSLCSEIIARLPIVTQIGARTKPVTEAGALYFAAGRNVLQQLGGTNAELHEAVRTLLLHLDNRMEKAAQLLANLLQSRDQWRLILPHGEDLSEDGWEEFLRGRFERSLNEIHEEASAALESALDETTAVKIVELMRHGAENLQRENKKNPHADCLQWKEALGYRGEDAERWKVVAGFLLTGDGDFRKQVDARLGFDPKSPRKAELKALLESLQGDERLLEALRCVKLLPPRQFTEQQRKVLRASFLLLRYALVELKIIFAREGKTDFQEILMGAQQALEEDTESIALSLGTRVQHLLVDEMQDTSVTQFRLLQNLVESWDGQSQTVFLVGDPKQSIYRFRQAEVALFLYARQYGLGGVALEPLTLTSNFRSQQSLVETTNKYFSTVFETTSDTDGIKFTPSLSAHREEEEDRMHWHPQVIEARTEETELASVHPAITEAKTLCDVIELYQAADRADGKTTRIAVLVGNRSHAWPIFEEMRQRRILYRAIEMETLADRQPLLDLLAITRCLLHAADRTAWLAVLRAPWCGLTLADLHTLCGGDEAQLQRWTIPELLRERIVLLSKDGQRRAQRVAATMKAAMTHGPQEKLATRVERVWHTLGGPVCVAAKDLPGMEQFFMLLHTLENEGETLTAARLEEQMQRLHAPAPVDGDAETAVEVLTIHKAKGLEWDVVLLPALHRKPRNDAAKLFVWSQQIRLNAEDKSDGQSALQSQIFLAPIQHAAEVDEPIGKYIRQRIAQRAIEEHKRLFYVAVTRARKGVHLFATVKKKVSGELTAPNAKSLLHIAWPFAQELFLMQAAGGMEHSDNVRVMPAVEMEPSSRIALGGIALGIAAGAATNEEARTIRPASFALSNFRRLPSDWKPASLPPDVGLDASAESVEGTAEENVPTILRPEGSWKARLFGTVIHALMQPLASILRANKEAAAVQAAVERLRPITLVRMAQGGYAPKEAQAAADRILRVLLEVARDPVAQWLLAKHAEVDSLLPEFEIPLTALLGKTIRSVRLDRMFMAGGDPGGVGSDRRWIVDFKTSTHGENDLTKFLAEQKILYAGQMEVYAEVVRATFPDPRPIHVGLYYPLLQQFLWWRLAA